MDILRSQTRGADALGTAAFLRNVAEIESFSKAPSQTTTCCATGTC